MRRSELLQVAVHCPHFNRPVAATRNLVIDRLVACAESDQCRAPRRRVDAMPSVSGVGDTHDRPFPRGCPVFPSLAK